MRLNAYPGYQAHEREHGDLLAALTTLSAGIDNGTAATSAGDLRCYRDVLPSAFA